MLPFSKWLRNATRSRDGAKLPNLAATKGSTEGLWKEHTCAKGGFGKFWNTFGLPSSYSILTIILRMFGILPAGIMQKRQHMEQQHREKGLTELSRKLTNHLPGLQSTTRILQNWHSAAASNSLGEQPLLVENTSNGNWSETLV